MVIKLSAIEKPKVVDAIIGAITEQLMQGKLRKGDKLPPEAPLAQQLSVSRNSVREALKVMEAFGVLEVRQGDGTYIASEVTETCLNPLAIALVMQTEAPMSLVEFRLVLEVGVAELVIMKASEEDLQHLKNMTSEFAALVKEGERDPGVLVEHDLAFHYQLLALAQNPMMEKVVRTVMQLLVFSMREHLSEPEGAPRAVRDHTRIVEALAKRDILLARRRIAESYEAWKTRVRLPS